MNKIRRDKFIEDYVGWLRFRMREILPAEASAYRMVEIVRRQHHTDVKTLVEAMAAVRKEGQVPSP